MSGEPAIDDLHLDGLGLRAAYQLGAAKAQVLIDGHLRGDAVAVRCCGNGNGDEYHMVPVRMGCLPLFFRHAESLHASPLLVPAIGDEATEVLEGIAVER